MPKHMEVILEVPSGSRVESMLTWLNKTLKAAGAKNMHAQSIREIKDAAMFELSTFRHELVPASLWEYKDVRYRLLKLEEHVLIQYEDIWYPSIEYDQYLGIGEKSSSLAFRRAVPDFLSKFKRIG